MSRQPLERVGEFRALDRSLPFQRDRTQTRPAFVRIVIAILLTVAMSPGGTELVELAAHVIGHGDLPHHDEGDETGCDEHTCTPLRHQCSCHAPMSAHLSARQASLASFTGPAIVATIRTSIVDGRVNEPPPLRPPIA